MRPPGLAGSATAGLEHSMPVANAKSHPAAAGAGGANALRAGPPRSGRGSIASWPPRRSKSKNVSGIIPRRYETRDARAFHMAG